ncbi:MAG: FKBP-type peptidyl-prolyl cis-trans isomerase [bacterium]|nr:FKBP-type peptidyl-prolyl cis-trans isomerase [bacterium]
MKNKLIILFVTVVLVLVGFKLIFNKSDNKTTTMNKEGVAIEILQSGQGEAAKAGDQISVHYTGTFENGTKFDSSLDRGQPFSFVLGAGQVIKGWDVGVEGMKIGEKRKLVIPPESAYGAGGIPGAIPQNSTLIFEVELLGIN